MPDELVYQGFYVRAEPYRLQDGGWTLEGVLLEHTRSRTVRFFLEGTATYREAAVELIFAEGKRLIDYRST